MQSGAMVWQQADAASVDIVSIDHDTHDQDIADAINEVFARHWPNAERVLQRLALLVDHPVATAIDALHASRRDPLRFIQPIS